MPLYLYWCCSGLKVTYWGTQSPAPVAPVPGRLTPTPYPGTYITTCDGENKSCIVSHWQVWCKCWRLLGGCCQVWGPLLTDRGWEQRPVLFRTVPCTVYSAREAGRSGGQEVIVEMITSRSLFRVKHQEATISPLLSLILDIVSFIIHGWLKMTVVYGCEEEKNTFIQLMSNEQY